MRTLQGKVVAITGAASGIGRALAESLLKRGTQVWLGDWNAPALASVEDELSREASWRGRFAVQTVDVREREQVLSWTRDCVERFGRADGLINNAGVNLHVPLEEMDPADLAWLMEVNFWGVFHGVQAFLPHLIASGDGHIVNLSSVLGLVATPGAGAYVASKFAVRGLTEALEIELAIARHPVQVTCVHPGGVRTGIVRNGRTRGRGPQSRTHDVVTREFEEKLARLSPEQCAESIVRAILKGKRRLLVGADARALDLLSRLAPSGYRRLFAWVLGR